MPIRPLPPALAETARLEFGEDSQKLDAHIRHLKLWILKQPHLRARTDDQWLAAFLRGCKYRLDQTKAKIDLYYSLRSTAPYLYSVKYFEPKFMEILNLGTILILPKTHKPVDSRVVLYRIGQYDPKIYNIIDIMAVTMLQQQICFMEDDNLAVAGTISIIDLAGTRLGHYTQLSIRQIRSVIQANQDAVPLRIKKIHFLNAPSFFGTFFNVVKRFLGEKTRNRVMIHGKSISTLHEHVPKEILPPEYGGTGDSIQDCIAYWKRKVRDSSSFFEEDLKYGSDESKRPGKSQKGVIDVPFKHLELD